MSSQSSKGERGGQNIPPAVKVFYSYAEKDINERRQLEQQLSPLREKNIIEEFHREMIGPGEDEGLVVKAQLKQAQLILLLISTDFLTEHYKSVEVKEIVTHYLEPDAAGRPRIIPILLRPTNLQDEDWLTRLKPLPPKWEPVTQWAENADDAFREIGRRIKQIIYDLRGAGTRQGSARFSLPPPARNPHFTGRADVLAQLHRRLMQKKPTALTQPQAISGLGGVGKTQIAVEYVHLHSVSYRNVFWVNADTRETLTKDYVKIAEGLGLVAPNQQDQRLTVQAVMEWLETYSEWLLVLDNADDLPVVSQFLPLKANGRILLTTREANVGSIAEKFEIEPMKLGEGVLLLLQRITKLPPATNGTHRERAEEIVRELDGLPLALDQAGAYIGATGCGLEGYLRLYKQRRSLLLSRRGPSTDHPKSVVTTFLLALDRVEKASREAADILRLCAFLAPDAIPETLLAVDQWKLNEACEVLRKFSLIRRDENTLTIAIHRLVQAVLRDNMDESTQRHWATQAVRNVAAAFPTTVEISTWPECQKLLPHVQVCTRHIAIYKFRAWLLLDTAGWYLFQRAQYREAEPLYTQARHILERVNNPDNPDLGQVQHHLGELHEQLGRYIQAEQELNQALDIRKRALGSDDPATAASLNSLAEVYRKQRKYAQAEPLYAEAQSLNELALVTSRRMLGLEHPSTLQCLNNLATLYDNLATLYREQGRYEEAERLYEQALEISKKLLGKKHPFTARIYHNLAELYKDQGKLDEAEHWHQEALKIRQQHFGEKNPETATSLNSLANVYERQGRREEAEQLYREALAIRKKELGPDSPDTATTLYGLAGLYRGWGKELEAERYYLETLLIWENVPGPGYPFTFACQQALADLYESQGSLRKAERLYIKALKERYQELRPNDRTVQQNLECLAKLYQQQHKMQEVAQLYEEAFERCTRRLGIDHPATDHYWTLLMRIYQDQHNEEGIEYLYEQAFEMRARGLKGDVHANIASFEQNVQDLAGLYRKQHKNAHLKSLYARAAEVCHERLGRDARLTQYYLNAWLRISELDVIPASDTRKLEPKWQPGNQPTTVILDDLAKTPELSNDIKRKVKQQDEQNLKEKLRKCYRELGVGDPATIQCRHDLATFYEKYDELKEAEYVYKEALFRCDHDPSLGPEHPTTIECQNDLAKCYWRHRKYDEAKPIIREALDNCELMLETTSPEKEITPIVAHSLDNGALYYKWRGLRMKAESLLQRALTLCEQKLGDEHPETILIRQHYADLLEDETLRRLRL